MKKYYLMICKIIIIIVLVLILNYIKKDKADLVNIPIDSYYSDRTYNLQDKYREEVRGDFINLLNVGDYESAYNMLSKDCKKNSFNNDIEDFKSYVKAKIIDVGELYINKVIKFYNFDLIQEIECTKIVYSLSSTNKDVNIYEENTNPGIKFTLIEYSPFKYEIEISK